jgi:hypothetical protein
MSAPIPMPWTKRRWWQRQPRSPMIRVSGDFGTLWAPAEALHWDRYFDIDLSRQPPRAAESGERGTT